MRNRSELRSERCILLSSTAIEAAIEAENGFNHAKVNVNQCVDALNQLKSLGLSSLELVSCSGSISKLERLRKHSSSTVRELAGSLINSWMKTPDDKQGRQGSSSLTYEEEEGNTQEVLNEEDESYKNAVLKTKVATERKLKKRKRQRQEEEKNEFVELFEAAIKSADASNVASMVFNAASGDVSKEEARSLVQKEVLSCVTALKSLMQFDITPTLSEQSKMLEKLEGLTKHKFHKIQNEATILLKHWRQKIVENDRKSRAKMFPKNRGNTRG